MTQPRRRRSELQSLLGGVPIQSHSQSNDADHSDTDTDSDTDNDTSSGAPPLTTIREYRSHDQQRSPIVYTVNANDRTLHQQPSQAPTQPLSLSSMSRYLLSIFLPVNYPYSVTEDYLAYQLMDTLQGVCSYLRGLLCTAALLTGMGVGSSSPSHTAINATINWLLRDGTGLFGSLIFGWFGARRFGINVKQYRLFADVINDIGLTLELISPLFPQWFLAIACLGSLCRALCGVAAGATRAAILQHFALANNAADLSAKEGMQEQAVTLIGMTLGWLVLTLMGHNTENDSKPGSQSQLTSYTGTWLLFTALTVIHVLANVRAMRSLIFTSLNTSRARSLMEHFIEEREILTPKQISDNENLFGFEMLLSLPSPRQSPPLANVRIALGGRIDSVESEQLLSAMKAQSIIHGDQPFVLVQSTSTIAVLLNAEAKIGEQRMIALALFHALVLASKSSTAARDGDADSSLINEVFGEAPAMFELFESMLADAGWNSTRWELECGEWRYQWN